MTFFREIPNQPAGKLIDPLHINAFIGEPPRPSYAERFIAQLFPALVKAGMWLSPIAPGEYRPPVHRPITSTHQTLC